ncbi:MAG TPA: VOC family protein [Candidatus Saccharimonadales bacterium]|nr:VOC family protein [Candidatus Saccharimonadales bacterium]
MNKPNIPAGHNTVNSFIITKDAPKLIRFLEKVFNAKEDPAAHTLDTDGLLLHSELAIGDSIVMVADTKPGWPFTPSLLRVYVYDVDETLKRAKELGAKIVTEPTDFYGDVFSRFVDPWNNLWWVFKHNPQPGGTADWEGAGEEVAASWEPSKEMKYIHDTLLKAMEHLGK